MRRGYPAVVGAVASLLMVAGVATGLSATAADTPTATPTPVSTSVQVSVVIPGVPDPAPTPTRSSSSPTSTPSPSNTSAVGCTPSVDGKAPVPASAPSDKAGKLTIDPVTVAANEWMVAKGSGYTPGERVQVAVYPGAVAVHSYKADAGGNVVARFRVPLETRPGDHVVEVSGWQSCFANKADFNVVSSSTAAVFPYLWWVIIVLGVIFVGLLTMALYFRQSIGRSFGGGLPATGPVT